MLIFPIPVFVTCLLSYQHSLATPVAPLTHLFLSASMSLSWGTFQVVWSSVGGVVEGQGGLVEFGRFGRVWWGDISGHKARIHLVTTAFDLHRLNDHLRPPICHDSWRGSFAIRRCCRQPCPPLCSRSTGRNRSILGLFGTLCRPLSDNNHINAIIRCGSSMVRTPSIITSSLPPLSLPSGSWAGP